jgi:hypothetical protein
MQTDLYTKAVLTVIALALSGIAIQLTTKDAHAQQGGFRFTESGALMVTPCDFQFRPRFQGEPLYVTCQNADKSSSGYRYKDNAR